MRKLISIYDTTSNFWELNPKFKTLDVFKDLYTKDKSRGKNKSSKDMWMICSFFEDESPYCTLEEDPEDKNGQCRVMSRDLMGDDNWWYENEERLWEAKERYELFCETPASRSMKRWEKKIIERDKVLAETEYQVGVTGDKGTLIGSNVAVLDKMLVDTSKIWDQYFKILELLDKENNNGGIRGEGQESLSDTGEI